jgi:polysaccharide biosynthesis protein PslG
VAPLRARHLVAIAALLTAAGCGSGSSTQRQTTPPTPPPSPPPSAEQFGANVGLLFNSRLYPAVQIAAQLQALHQTGATVARSDAAWETAEPVPPSGRAHHYRWTFADIIVASLAAQGLRWLPIIDYSPTWAESTPGQVHSPPSNPGDYAAFAGALASRYGPGGSFWRAHPQLPAQPVDTYEIWNEPDSPSFWYPTPNPTAYADLYQRARDAIVSAQPSAKVIVGGLTQPRTFLPALLAGSPGLRGHVDGVGIHPYGATPQVVVARIRAARSVLRGLSLADVPLYVTEFGWTTRPPGALDYLPERLRPGYIQLTLAGLGHTNCSLAVVLLYAWVTPERNPADPQDWFGIHPPGGGTSPDTEAFVRGLSAARAPGPTASVC